MARYKEGDQRYRLYPGLTCKVPSTPETPIQAVAIPQYRGPILLYRPSENIAEIHIHNSGLNILNQQGYRRMFDFPEKHTPPVIIWRQDRSKRTHRVILTFKEAPTSQEAENDYLPPSA